MTPEGGRGGSARHVPDLAWLRGRPPGDDGSPATLRLTVRDADPGSAAGSGAARRRVDAWFAGLPADAAGLRGEGGWVVREVAPGEHEAPGTVVLDLTSAGEDVADGIEAAADCAYDALADGTVILRWEQRPR